MGSGKAPELGLAAQEALQGGGLRPRLWVGRGLADLPLHEKHLELLLLLRAQVPQLRVFGQDSLQLCSELTHRGGNPSPGQTGGDRSWFGWQRPCVVLHGSLKSNGALGHGPRLLPGTHRGLGQQMRHGRGLGGPSARRPVAAYACRVKQAHLLRLLSREPQG